MHREKLKDLRKRHGLMHKEMAEKLDIARSHYTMIENGNRNPSLRVIENLINEFGEEAKSIFFSSEIA